MSNRLSVCAACGSADITTKLVSRSYGHDASDFIFIDNVPIDVCRACGESYISGASLKRIEQLRRERDTLARVPIPVGHV